MSFSSQYEKWKKRRSFKDKGISPAKLKHLMDHIDLQGVLMQLGIEVKQQGPHEWRGTCPDHVQKCGRIPSGQDWVINDETGLTFCFTESRGSNIVEIAKTLWDLPTAWDAYEKLLSGASCAIKFDPNKWVREQEQKEEEKLQEEEKLKKSLEEVTPIFETCKVNSSSLEYFQNDGIDSETLDKFGIVSAEYGRYRNRVLIPFFGKGLELSGYIAVDTLGKEKWAREHAKYHYGVDSTIPLEELIPIFEKKYRKTLYAPGFQSRFHLYGMYENLDFLENRKDFLMLVEGERDCLKMMQEGIPCLSIHGTFIKEEQITLLRDEGFFTSLKEIYLGFDMDNAGNDACSRGLKVLSQEIDYTKIFCLNFPNGPKGEKQDPKKFTGSQILELMKIAKENKIRSR